MVYAEPAENKNAWALEKKEERSGSIVPGPYSSDLVSGDHNYLGESAHWTFLRRASQWLPLRILDLEFFYQNPLRTSRDDPWDH